MLSVDNQSQLQQLRPGDRLKYHGVQWRVKNYSNYVDPKGYETTEWLLYSEAGAEYYLLREFDPQNPEGLVHCYLAEKIHDPRIYQPKSSQSLTSSLWIDIQNYKTPYPELRSLSRNYYFESQLRELMKEKEQILLA